MALAGVSPPTSTAQGAVAATGAQRDLRLRACVDHQMIVALRQRADRGPEHLRLQQAARHRCRPARRLTRCAREPRSRVMTSPNDACPRTSSAMPGADGSFEITSMFGEANARSTSTTRAVRASVRASAIAVSVVPTFASGADHGDAAAGLARLLEGRGDIVDGRTDGAARRARRNDCRRPATGGVRFRAAWARRAAGRWRGSGHWRGAPAARYATSGTMSVLRARRAIAFAAQQRAGHHEGRRQTERAERRDQDDRHLLREIRDVRHHGARDDAGVGGGRRDAVARGRLAIFGEIGFEQIALRLGLALQRAQLHVLVAGRGGLPLELVEIRGRAFRAARRRPWRRFPASAPSGRLRRGSAGRDRRPAPASP